MRPNLRHDDPHSEQATTINLVNRAIAVLRIPQHERRDHVTAHPQCERRLFTEPRDLWTELTETNRLLATLPPRAFDLLAPHLRNSSIEAGTVLHEFGQPVRDV